MWYRNLRSSLSQSGDCSTSGSLNMFSLVIFHSKKLSSINFLLQFDCVFSIELQFLPLMRIVWKQARIQAIIRRSEARGITRCNVNILSISNYSLLISHLDVLPCKQLNFCNSDSYKIPFKERRNFPGIYVTFSKFYVEANYKGMNWFNECRKREKLTWQKFLRNTYIASRSRKHDESTKK